MDNCIGILYFPNGDKYEGDFVEGKLTGKGITFLKRFFRY
jgi:hypothetical protein